MKAKEVLDQFDPGVQRAIIYGVALVLVSIVIGMTTCGVVFDRQHTKRVEAIHGKGR